MSCYYEGCTIDEIRAYRELETEYFDFGEGEMRACDGRFSEDAYYEMCLPEENGTEERPYEPKPKLRNRTRLNQYERKRITKRKMDRLYRAGKWWVVSDRGTHKARLYLSGRRKVAKKESSKKVRKHKDIGNGCNYRKVHEYWYAVL